MLKFEEQIAILPLTIDGVFKMYFEDPRNLPQLRDFLITHLELENDDLDTIQILNPGLPKDGINDKGFTVDLLLKTKLGNDIHLEMQTSTHMSFEARIQLYNARKAGGQIKVGQDYTNMKRTISLVITKFSVFKDADDYHETILMRRKNGKVFTNAQEIHIIDLTKINSIKTNERQKYLWGMLFMVETKEELEMLAKESTEMADATEKLIEVSADERAQAYALSRENAEFARLLHETGLREQMEQQTEQMKQQIEQKKQQLEQNEKEYQEALEAATEQATHQGIELGTIETAKRMLAENVTADFISKVTNLKMEKIQALQLEV